MIKKIFIIIFISIILINLLSLTSVVNATSLNSIINGADSFVEDGKDSSENAMNRQIIDSTSNLLYNTLLIVGVCIAAIIGAVLGIQFITGSVEQKVKVKEALIPFVIGCIVIFSAFGIWRLVIVVLR